MVRHSTPVLMSPFLIALILALLTSCSSGSQSAGGDPAPVPTSAEHLDAINQYSVGPAETFTELANITVFAVKNSLHQPLSESLPICYPGEAQVMLTPDTVSVGGTIGIAFVDCASPAASGLINGQMTITLTTLNTDHRLQFSAEVATDLVFDLPSGLSNRNLQFDLDFEASAHMEQLSLRTLNADGRIGTAGFNDQIVQLQLEKTVDLSNQEFAIEYSFELASERIKDHFQCQTQNPIRGNVEYLLLADDYAATSGNLICQSQRLGSVAVTASTSGITTQLQTGGLNVRSQWREVIDGSLFHAGPYAMANNYQTVIPTPNASVLGHESEFRQVEDLLYYFDGEDDTALLIQNHINQINSEQTDTGYITLIDQANGQVLHRIEFETSISRAFMDQDLLFLCFGTKIHTYRADRLSGIRFETSFDPMTTLGFELDLYYAQFTGLKNKNALLARKAGIEDDKIYQLHYDSRGHITSTKLFHQGDGRIFVDHGDNVYIANSLGNLTRLGLDEDGSVAAQSDHHFQTSNWDLVDFSVIHSGSVFAVLLSWNFSQYNFATYVFSDDGGLLKVADVPMDIRDHNADLSTIDGGEGLIQWQENNLLPGAITYGKYRRFSIDAAGAVTLEPVAGCALANGFSSYRYGNPSNTKQAFVGGGNVPVYFPYDRASPQCQLVDIENRGHLLEDMTIHASNQLHHSIYVYRDTDPGIATLRYNDGRLTEQGFVSTPVADIKKLLVAPDGGHLYGISSSQILGFEVSPDGQLQATTQTIAGANATNIANYAAISPSGEQLYVHQSVTVKVDGRSLYKSAVAIYDRDMATGELSYSKSIEFDEPLLDTKWPLHGPGPIAVSPDDEYLYVTNRYFGKLYVVALHGSASPAVTRAYLDPSVHPDSPNRDKGPRGLSITSGFSFAQDGDSMQITTSGNEFNPLGTGETAAVLASFKREKTTGQLQLRNVIIKSTGLVTASSKHGYLAPQVIGDKLFTIRVNGFPDFDKPQAVDIYGLDEEGFLTIEESITVGHFGSGLGEISIWSDVPLLIGINPLKEALSTATLELQPD